MKKTLFLIIGLIGISLILWRVADICAYSKQESCNQVSGVTISPTTASPSATLIPIIASPTTSGITPTEGAVSTITPQIGTAVSANNTASPQAGSSASINMPTGAPDTSLRK